MKTILAIVGMAGVGKDTAANYLKEKNGWNVICSYTNRPMRNGETQGKEHIFVANKAPETTFAYTNYGGYDYWTDIEQFRDDTINIYVVDEYGLKDSYKRAKELGGWKVLSMLIEATTEARNGRGVNSNRTNRDVNRNFDGIIFDYQIINNGSIGDLYKQLDNLNI